MKLKIDKKYLKIGITLFLVLAATIIFYLIVADSNSIGTFFSFIFGVLAPVIYGFVFAYILNPLLKILEFPFIKKWGLKIYKNDERKAKSFTRAIGIVFTYILVIAFFSCMLWFIIPKLRDSVMQIIESLPVFYEKTKNFFYGLFNADSEIGMTLGLILDSASESIKNWLSTDFISSFTNYFGTVFSSVYSIIIAFVNVIIGLIISIYVLAEKDKFSAQSKKLLYSFFNTEKVTRFIKWMKSVDKIFTGFISGKIIDSVFVGFVTYICMWVFNLPYKELVAFIIGVTNVIPFFGPYIGAIPSALLILFVSPAKCITFIILILLIQQIDGNVFAPKILGNSTGLSGFWVLVSLLVFGGLFGFVGMLIGVPAFAVIYMIIKQAVINRLERKNMSFTTTEFKRIDYINPETNDPVFKKTDEELKAEKAEENKRKKEEKKKKKEQKKK